MSYKTNIIKKTAENEKFREVLFTGSKTQLVVMSIPPGGEIGEEKHPKVEQTLFFLTGEGTAYMDGVDSPIKAGDVIVITPGVIHNFVNTGKEPMKIYTLYAPPNHIDGRMHETKEDADADIVDEDFSETIE
jgi:mannose-6-phosphate isomerase-like protein (cupin superfamily)